MDAVIGEPVDMEDRCRWRGLRGSLKHCGGDRGDGGEEIGLARQAIVHDAAIGDARRVDSVRVDRAVGFDRRDHGGNEGDVIDTGSARLAATVTAGVPGPIKTVGIGHNESIRIGFPAPGGAFGLTPGAEAAMQHDDKGHRIRVSSDWDVNAEGAGITADPHAPDRCAGRKRGRRVDIGWCGADPVDDRESGKYRQECSASRDDTETPLM